MTLVFSLGWAGTSLQSRYPVDVRWGLRMALVVGDTQSLRRASIGARWAARLAG
jgi:hypothetical protein